MNEPITLLINTRDRATELTLLLQSIRTQTYKGRLDIVIIDGSKPQPVFSIHFVQSLLNRMKAEGFRFHLGVAQLLGVCHARQQALKEDPFDNPYQCRIDDDVVLQPDYVEKLMEGILQGFDLMSGLTPHCASPPVIREAKFVKPVVNKVEVDEGGNIVKLGDDCGFHYDNPEIIPTHHFRSCALYKKGVIDDYNLPLSQVGFREEFWVSIKAMLKGYKLGVHTGAVNYHLQTPSGGVRFHNYPQLVQADEHQTREWFKRKFKEKGDFLKKYDEQWLK
jgi:hypothetical protein